MPLDMILQEETKGLTEEAMMEVIRFVRFMKAETGVERRPNPLSDTERVREKYRKAGLYKGQGWMSEDFDAPLDDFEESM